jgi:uncharacterized protein YbjT (DUF2867 family)
VSGARVVVVTGATGTQGGAVTRALLLRGFAVKALTRRPDGPAARALASLGAQPVPGDMDDPASLRAAFLGADAVFAVTDFFTHGVVAEERHGRSLADAAQAAGVSQLVFSSVAGADRAPGVPHFASKFAVEQHIRSLGVPATILRPAIFLEDLDDKKYVPPANWGMMRKLIGDDRPLHWVAAADIGAAAAAAFAAPERFIGKTVPLVSTTSSLASAREAFVRVRGRKPLALAMPAGIFSRFVSRELVAMWRWLRDHDMDPPTGDSRSLLPAPVTVESWLRDRSGARSAR